MRRDAEGGSGGFDFSADLDVGGEVSGKGVEVEVKMAEETLDARLGAGCGKVSFAGVHWEGLQQKFLKMS